MVVGNKRLELDVRQRAAETELSLPRRPEGVSSSGACSSSCSGCCAAHNAMPPIVDKEAGSDGATTPCATSEFENLVDDGGPVSSRTREGGRPFSPIGVQTISQLAGPKPIRTLRPPLTTSPLDRTVTHRCDDERRRLLARKLRCEHCGSACAQAVKHPCAGESVFWAALSFCSGECMWTYQLARATPVLSGAEPSRAYRTPGGGARARASRGDATRSPWRSPRSSASIPVPCEPPPEDGFVLR